MLSISLAGKHHQPHYGVTEHFQNGCLEMFPRVSIAMWYIVEKDINVTSIKKTFISTQLKCEIEFLYSRNYGELKTIET